MAPGAVRRPGSHSREPPPAFRGRPAPSRRGPPGVRDGGPRADRRRSRALCPPAYLGNPLIIPGSFKLGTTPGVIYRVTRYHYFQRLTNRRRHKLPWGIFGKLIPYASIWLCAELLSQNMLCEISKLQYMLTVHFRTTAQNTLLRRAGSNCKHKTDKKPKTGVFWKTALVLTPSRVRKWMKAFVVYLFWNSNNALVNICNLSKRWLSVKQPKKGR